MSTPSLSVNCRSAPEARQHANLTVGIGRVPFVRFPERLRAPIGASCWGGKKTTSLRNLDLTVWPEEFLH